MRSRHRERHRLAGTGWLRASVLGANDGIVSTASLILGVAAAQANAQNILVSGAAGLVAGAMSMAIGEYISVHSQADTERAALAEERAELAVDFDGEHRELTDIYMHRGIERGLAQQVATQLMAHDALGAHARDELELSAASAARPLQAALSSAASFAIGAAIPLCAAAIARPRLLIPCTVAASLGALLLLGGLSAKVGGADVLQGAVRVAGWSALAMAITAGAGALLAAYP